MIFSKNLLRKPQYSLDAPEAKKDAESLLQARVTSSSDERVSYIESLRCTRNSLNNSAPQVGAKIIGDSYQGIDKNKIGSN
jgi:hypothetical protein